MSCSSGIVSTREKDFLCMTVPSIVGFALLRLSNIFLKDSGFEILQIASTSSASRCWHCKTIDESSRALAAKSRKSNKDYQSSVPQKNKILQPNIFLRTIPLHKVTSVSGKQNNSKSMFHLKDSSET